MRHAESYTTGKYGCLWCKRFFADFRYYLQHVCVKNDRGKQTVDFIGTFDYGKQANL